MAYTNTDTRSGMSGLKYWGIAATLLIAWIVGLAYGHGGALHLLAVGSASMVGLKVLQSR